MKRMIILAALASLSGCTVEVQPEYSRTLPATRPSALVVYIDANGKLVLDGWTISEADLPTAYHQREASELILRGQPGSDFAKALEVQASMKAAGIDNVTIGTVNGW